ncbi:50S ribosomal protein L23 [compost metagenome]
MQTAFNVTVLSVNVSKVHGKTRRVGRGVSKGTDWKKAVVTLQPGDSIEFFEGV